MRRFFDSFPDSSSYLSAICRNITEIFYYPGYPLARTGYDTPSQDWMGCPLQPGLDTIPPARTGRGAPSRQDWIRYPQPGMDGVPPPPSQDWMEYPLRSGLAGLPRGQDWIGTPLARTGLGSLLVRTGWSTSSGQDWLGTFRPRHYSIEYPPGRTEWGTPRPLPGQHRVPPGRTGWDIPHPETEQQSKYLLRCGRFASCVHAGRLSCFTSILTS